MANAFRRRAGVGVATLLAALLLCLPASAVRLIRLDSLLRETVSLPQPGSRVAPKALLGADSTTRTDSVPLPTAPRSDTTATAAPVAPKESSEEPIVL